MTAYFLCHYYCDFCKEKFCRLGQHRCPNTCKSCFRLFCEIEQEYICNNCNRKCNNSTCFNYHKEQFCLKSNICNVCNTIAKNPHVCYNQKFCFNCKKVTELDHKCFILTRDQCKTKKKKFNGFVFFDF